jgi:NADPH:quinone reductase-like Zn-dependent oxidoreductase
MQPQVTFGISVLLGFVVWGMIGDFRDEGSRAWRSTMANQQVVLITGASSGVAQSTARLLSQRGYTVLGTSRNSASAESIRGVEMLSLDVRADDSVKACVEAVHRRSGHLDCSSTMPVTSTPAATSRT